MTRRVVIRPPSPNGKTRSLLGEKPTETTTKTCKTMTRGEKSTIKRCGEVAGETTAECVAVCCCCPCTVMNILVLAIIKMPASLCKKAIKRHRLMRRKQEERLWVHAVANDLRREELEREFQAMVAKRKIGGGEDDDARENDAVELEKEMWERFYATGFWRSPSQRSS